MLETVSREVAAEAGTCAVDPAFDDATREVSRDELVSAFERPALDRGWREREDGRGDPWGASFAKDVPRMRPGTRRRSFAP